jgi:serine/threonine-protein kinase RsbW
VDVSWTVRVPSEAASVCLVRRMLIAAAASAGIDPEVGYDLGLAVTEACANVVRHAGAAYGYRVVAGINDERCCVDVIDEGRGFVAEGPVRNPADNEQNVATQGVRERVPALAVPAVPQPDPLPAVAESGRGLMLIKALSDRVSVRSHPQLGAVIHFERDLRPMTSATGALN